MAEPRALRGNVMMLDAALRYARCGLPVFPLWPVLEFKPGSFTCGCGKGLRCGTNSGKHPLAALVPNGLKSATIDANIIKDWWATWPEANIAIATGPVVVIDIDPRHRGDASLAQLEAKHGNFPPTWRVRTGGGGLHIYFTVPSDITIKNSVSEIAPGVDVRGYGGYVVAPPSKHISGGKYEWTAGKELAPLPSWLTTSLQQPHVKAPSSGPGLASARPQWCCRRQAQQLCHAPRRSPSEALRRSDRCP